jgi:hypothetical protein
MMKLIAALFRILVSKLFFIKILHNLKRDFIFCTLGIFAKLKQRVNRVKQPNEWFDRSRGQTKRSNEERLARESHLLTGWKNKYRQLILLSNHMKSGLLDKVKRVDRG